MSTLVSIVIPAYNHALFLPEALDSVIAQDYPALELVVIDDGSTDETPEVLSRYGSRVRWERQTRGGQSAALNRGWSKCRGAILSYLSADDRLAPGAVSAAVAALGRKPAVALVYGDFEIIDRESRVVKHIHTAEYDYGDMLLRARCVPGPGVFMRREAFEAAGPWNPDLSQMPDFEYWLRLGLVGPFERIPSILAAFRVHRGSQTFSPPDDSRAQEVVRIVSSLFERTDLPETYKARRARALANAHVVETQLRIQTGSLKLAASSLRRAFALDPMTLFSVLTVRRLRAGIASRLRQVAT